MKFLMLNLHQRDKLTEKEKERKQNALILVVEKNIDTIEYKLKTHMREKKKW